MTSTLVLALILLGCAAPLASGYCYEIPIQGAFNPKTGMFEFSNCVLPDGSSYEPGQSWRDKVKCEDCVCGTGCCGFGFALAKRSKVYNRGRLCKAVRVGDCNYKFVEVDQPSITCEETQGTA